MRIDTSSMQLANETLAELKKLFQPVKGWLKDDAEAYISAYKNGRENGYLLTVWIAGLPNLSGQFYATFSENRRSDDVVVYLSDFTDLKKELDAAYQKRKLFDTPKQAANFIFRQFKRWRKEVTK